MTAAIGQNETTAQAARKGLALLRLMAEAADRQTPDWVYRRVEQLEFLDTRAVRWRVSVDFVVPETAPVIHIGGRPFRLVPLTSWEKSNLVGFNLRDECGNTIWLPTSQYTGHLLASALVYWARDIVGRPPPLLEKRLKAIVSEWPSPEQKEEERKTGKEMKPFHAETELMTAKHGEAAAKDYLDALRRLEDNPSFWSQLSELWHNVLIVVAVADSPGTRRVLKMTFESKVEFRRPDSRRLRILQSLGWRGWRLELFLGGRGGNHHLEVAAPPGVDIVRIRARPVNKDLDPTYVVAYGGAPHVHIRIKADQRSRYLTTIRVRVSRPGWLTMCWLAGLIIPAVLLAGALKLSVLFSGATEAGTAATLLLALLAVFATMLVGPGAHPLASRLLWASRCLIVVDSGVFLLGVGSLLLLQSGQLLGWMKVLWWALVGVSGLCAVMLTLSRLLPKGPNQVEKADRLKKEKPDAMLTLSRLLPKGPPRKGTKEGRWPVLNQVKSGCTRAWGMLKKGKSAEESGKPDPAALAIPAADGYHYGDNPDHKWDEKSQTELVRALRRAEVKVCSKRHRDLGRARNQVACRLHAVLCELVPGGVSKEITAAQATQILEQVTQCGAGALARRELAGEFVGDLRRLDAQLRKSKKKLAEAVQASGTTVTQVFGVGPVIAATVIGDVRDVSRFASRDRFAAYNGTAPIEVSSGNRIVHRLPVRGNRRLNHAIHIAAVTQIRYQHGDGRAYYDKKIAEGKTGEEALRALKRQISDAIYKHLKADAITAEYGAWARRRLDDVVLDYLFLDASLVRMHPGQPAEPILAAWGITTGGKPAFIGLAPGSGESTDAWAGFLTDLKDRGLTCPLLIISDGAQGLIAATEQVYPQALRQRCLIHRLRRVLAKIPAGMQAEIRDGYWKIFDTENLETPAGPQLVELADHRLTDFAARYAPTYPAAMNILLTDQAELTSYLRFPAEHHHRIQHSDFAERTFGEARRRAKVIGRFPGQTSCISLVWAVLDRSCRGWRGLTVTADGIRLLEDLRRSLLEPPRQLRPRAIPGNSSADTAETAGATV